MHWVSWDILVRPKPQSGMGFRDMRDFNQALLARQAWILNDWPNSLSAWVLCAKYYPRATWLTSYLVATHLLHGLLLFMDCIC
jgi:hypothetical protein